MSETQNIKIKSYSDFQKQLNTLKGDTSATLLSYFKYCWLHDNENDFNFYKDLIRDELKEFDLKAYVSRITDEMNIILKYKKTEAVVYIKAYGIDIFLHKL